MRGVAMEPISGSELAAAIAESNRKGRGINSIPVRFALMTAVVCLFAFASRYFFLLEPKPASLSIGQVTVGVLTLALPPAVTFLAARKLAAMIAALRQSTLAILDGEIDSPVNVDCACEVGGLADSFRAMVARLNGNILRMNVLAYTDSVTGLPNRAVINHVLDLARQKAPGECKGAVFFIDLDGFKRVNDTYGHDAGDELLRLASKRIVENGFGVDLDRLETCTTAFGELCRSCPETLVFARFAGDEFVGLLPGDRSEANLREIAENILKSLRQPFSVFGNEVRICASIGIASANLSTDPRDLVVHADMAMYRAKETGRNCVSFFDLELKHRVAERTELEKDLRDALERDQLHLNFQPKVCARTHALVGVEALARWDHPRRGPIGPDQFVPIAEQSGSMIALGEAVLRMAARQGQNWSEAGEPIPIAINVSPVQFHCPRLVENVLSALERSHLDPALLELELTETLAMADYATTKHRLDTLRAEGVRIAIDDFGTGYSNLSQLARLNFDLIKIDRSLVSGIGMNGKSEAMLNATVNMAHALGYKVVAEGIENQEQMAFLASIGCDQFQGFHFARPMLASDLIPWAKDRLVGHAGGNIETLHQRSNAA